MGCVPQGVDVSLGWPIVPSLGWSIIPEGVVGASRCLTRLVHLPLEGVGWVGVSLVLSDTPRGGGLWMDMCLEGCLVVFIVWMESFLY